MQQPESITMADALLLSAIQKLEIRQIDEKSDEPDSPEDYMCKEVISNLRIIMDFLEDKKLRKGSKLDYLVSDVIEMALELNENEDRRRLDVAIRSVHTWLEEVKARMLGFGSDGAEMKSRIAGGVDEPDEDNDKDAVGLDEDVEMVLRRAIFNEGGSAKWRSTSSIVGMVGIGKTTLARQVYNHTTVVERFERRAWVRVSSDLSIKEVLIKLIQQVVDSGELERGSFLEEMEREDNRSLRQMLYRHLEGVRYFIVLDDVRREMRLRSILNGLPYQDKGSRLLLTSRCRDIDGNDYTHTMKSLDSDKSWQLFLKTIHEHEFPRHLEKKGKQILFSKCGGLPLAIKEVGMQLAKKKRRGVEWEELLESIDLGSTLELLETTYDLLKPQLKSSFLHLALFKENTTMRTEKLYQILKAAGTWFYSYDALNESILEAEDVTAENDTKSCRMNVMLHRLSVKKAAEEIGFEILSNDGNNRRSQSPRHRVVICSRDKFDYSTDQDEHLVSLFFRGGGYFNSSPSYWQRLELLKILDLEDFGLKILPETIFTLKELIYLGLRNNYTEELPHSLGCLKKLEVVDIAQNFMVEVPDIIWEMVSLQHLYMSDIICREPLKIEALRNLMTLTYISMDNWTYEVSGLLKLTTLRKLGIEAMDGNLDESKLFATLAKLGNLQCLILRGFRFRVMPCLDELGILQRVLTLKLDGLLARLPSTFPNILNLNLVNSCLDEDPMPVLEKLPNLVRLKLRNAYTGQQMKISKGSFRRLNELHIKELWNLRNVQVGEDAIRLLLVLEIKNCPYLETLPEEIGSMNSLKELKMVTTKRIATKIRRSPLISKIMIVDINP